jgi:hypothetical protein
VTLALVGLLGAAASIGATHALAGEGEGTTESQETTGQAVPPGVTIDPAITFDRSNPGFKLLKPGSKLPSGAECARRVKRNPWEPVLENDQANHTVGHKIKPNLGLKKPGKKLIARVDGNFTGTTDEIIQWASCKWGVDTDPVRAQAFVESQWHQSAVGDNGQSFGITQIKEKFHPWAYPGARDSTAMNFDYTLALWRLCYEGYVKRLPSSARWSKEGCFGWHFSDRWGSPEAKAYVERIGAAIAARPWWTWPGQVALPPGTPTETTTTETAATVTTTTG